MQFFSSLGILAELYRKRKDQDVEKGSGDYHAYVCSSQ